jgi:hypothetical protein
VIIFAGPGLSPVERVDAEEDIRLRLIVQVHPHCRAVPGFNPGGRRLVLNDPSDEASMRLTVMLVTGRRWHVDDSFDQLRFLQVG